MADRLLTAAVAGALFVAGCAFAALGFFGLLSPVFCPPIVAAQTIVCVPANMIPWYAFAIPVAWAAAGLLMVAEGLVLYRGAKTI